MINISTNATLALKFVFPIFWLVFFGSFTVGVWISTPTPENGITMESRWIMTAILAFGVAFLYWSAARLKRIEADGDFAYVTNYYKTYRYPWHNIVKIEEKDFLFFKTIHLHFGMPGNFGKSVYCVASLKRLNQFFTAHPALAKRFSGDENV